MSFYRPCSIKIFLTSGIPDGLRIIEKTSWNGSVIICSRAEISQLRKRKEVETPGIYVLLGTDGDSGFAKAYIGESDSIINRINSHERDKEFWDTIVVLTGVNNSLNKAHVQYLEARLIEMAANAKRCELENGNSPEVSTLSEPEIADMENFLIDFRLICSTVGIKIFEVPSVDSALMGVSQHLLQLKSGGEVIALGVDAPEGFLVKNGSKALVKEVPSFPENAREFRRVLLEKGVITKSGDEFYVFSQDYVFNSPSQAAFILLGRPSNGRTEWKTESGKTLKEIQEA